MNSELVEVSHFYQPNCLVHIIVAEFKITKNHARGCVICNLEAQALGSNGFEQSPGKVARDDRVRPGRGDDAPFPALTARVITRANFVGNFVAKLFGRKPALQKGK